MSQPQNNVMSLQGLLYEAMTMLRKLGVDLNHIENQLVQTQAQTFGGFGKNNEGKGIIQQLMAIGFSAARHAGQAIDEQSMGQFVSGFIGAAGVGAMGTMTALSSTDFFSTPEMKSELASAGKFKNALNEMPQGDQTIQGSNEQEMFSEDEIRDRLAQFTGSEGKAPQLSGFDNTDLDRTALLRAQSSGELAKIKANVESYHQGLLDKQSSLSSQKANNLTMTANQGVQAATSGSQGGFGIKQSNAEQKAQHREVESKVQDNLMSNYNSQMQQEQQDARGNLQMADQAATAYAQVVQARSA